MSDGEDNYKKYICTLLLTVHNVHKALTKDDTLSC